MELNITIPMNTTITIPYGVPSESLLTLRQNKSSHVTSRYDIVCDEV